MIVTYYIQACQLCKWKREFSDTKFEIKKPCQHLLQSSSGWKWRIVWKLLQNIYSRTLVRIQHWRSKVSDDCSSLPVPLPIWSSYPGFPVLCPSWSTPLLVSSVCAGPPSAVVPLVPWPCPGSMSHLQWHLITCQ